MPRSWRSTAGKESEMSSFSALHLLSLFERRVVLEARISCLVVDRNCTYTTEATIFSYMKLLSHWINNDILDFLDVIFVLSSCQRADKGWCDQLEPRQQAAIPREVNHVPPIVHCRQAGRSDVVWRQTLLSFCWFASINSRLPKIAFHGGWKHVGKFDPRMLDR
jgi:hypothetical protein